MNAMLWTAAVLVASYLVGSLSFAVIVSRSFGLADPRSYGSGNPGATNVLRSGSKGAAMLTLALDALKGYLPVVLVLIFGSRVGLDENVAAFAGLAAFVGHLWPVFFRFRGGKGVATAAGALLGINPFLGLATLATWLVVAVFFRYSSLASLVAAVFAPFYLALIWGIEPAFIAVVGMSLLLIWRHEPNIRKLLAGTESRIGQKAGAAPHAGRRGRHRGARPGHTSGAPPHPKTTSRKGHH